MKVVVCIKQDFEAIGSFIPVTVQEGIDTREMVPVLNPADASALAMALDAFAKDPGDEVIAVSVGPERCEAVLREALAAGATRAVRMWDDAWLSPDGMVEVSVIAHALATVCAELEADVVVCGSRGLLRASGSVGCELAELLDRPVVPNVVSVTDVATADNVASFVRKVKNGYRQTVSCPLPLVITVEEGAAEPSYPSMRSMLDASLSEIPLNEADEGVMDGLGEIGRSGSSRFVKPSPRAKKVAPDYGSMDKKTLMQTLIGIGSSGRKSAVLEGPADEVAEQMVAFLEDRGLAPWCV